MNNPSWAAMVQEWKNLINQMAINHLVRWTDSSVNTQSLILSATEVVSIYSNLLTEAVVLGRLAVSWNSEVGRVCMRKSFGLESFPLCRFGAVYEVWTPEDYAAKVPPVGTGAYQTAVTQAQKVVLSDGRNTERVAEAILSFAF